MASLPQSFRAPVWLQRLNILAVAASLAACTGVALHPLGHGFPMGGSFEDEGSGSMSGFMDAGAASALSTFVFALLWARMLRVRASWVGWAACVPIAALNAGVALFLCSPSMGSLVLGATVGAFIWVPALILTLLFFGLPLHFARAAADRGMSSEDRGECVVGVVAAVLAAIAFAFDLQDTGGEAIVVGAFAGVAMATGLSSAFVSLWRERQRGQFLAQVRSGHDTEFRIEETAQSAVVVRVAQVGHAYRSSEIAEPVLELDAAGDPKSRLSA